MNQSVKQLPVTIGVDKNDIPLCSECPFGEWTNGLSKRFKCNISSTISFSENEFSSMDCAPVNCPFFPS